MISCHINFANLGDSTDVLISNVTSFDSTGYAKTYISGVNASGFTIKSVSISGFFNPFKYSFNPEFVLDIPNANKYAAYLVSRYYRPRYKRLYTKACRNFVFP